MASRLMFASSRTRTASFLKFSAFKRSFASGKFEEEQLGEEMKKKFDEMNSKCWKFLELEVDRGPRVPAYFTLPFTLEAGGRWIVGSNLYVVDRDDVKRKDTRRRVKTIGFDIDPKKRTVVLIDEPVDLDV